MSEEYIGETIIERIRIAANERNVGALLDIEVELLENSNNSDNPLFNIGAEMLERAFGNINRYYIEPEYTQIPESRLTEINSQTIINKDASDRDKTWLEWRKNFERDACGNLVPILPTCPKKKITSIFDLVEN